MTNPYYCQSKNAKTRASNYQFMFKQTPTSPKNVQFQEFFEKMKKDSDKATKNCFSKGNHKVHQINNQNLKNIEVQKKNNHLIYTIGKKTQSRENNKQNEAEIQKKRLRALSSKKFDCIRKKNTSRKPKRLTMNLMEYAKLNECPSNNSKKSTDNSNSSQIEKIKNQNEIIYKNIKVKEKKIKQMEKEINEQEKKHQSQKQLYNLNIHKLKKKACDCQEEGVLLKEIDQSKQSFLSEGRQSSEQDRLSLDSK